MLMDNFIELRRQRTALVLARTESLCPLGAGRHGEDLCARSDDENQRLTNHVFYTWPDITEDQESPAIVAERFATITQAAAGEETERVLDAFCDVAYFGKST